MVSNFQAPVFCFVFVYREILISQLETFTKQLNEELSNYSKSSKNTPKGKNMPNTIGIIVWITQSENTVNFIILINYKNSKM